AGVANDFLDRGEVLRAGIISHDSFTAVDIQLGIRHAWHLAESSRKGHNASGAIHIGDLERNLCQSCGSNRVARTGCRHHCFGNSARVVRKRCHRGNQRCDRPQRNKTPAAHGSCGAYATRSTGLLIVAIRKHESGAQQQPGYAEQARPPLFEHSARSDRAQASSCYHDGENAAYEAPIAAATEAPSSHLRFGAAGSAGAWKDSCPGCASAASRNAARITFRDGSPTRLPPSM